MVGRHQADRAQRLKMAGQRPSSLNASGLIVGGRSSTHCRRRGFSIPVVEIDGSRRSSCGNDARRSCQIRRQQDISPRTTRTPAVSRHRTVESARVARAASCKTNRPLPGFASLASCCRGGQRTRPGCELSSGRRAYRFGIRRIRSSAFARGLLSTSAKAFVCLDKSAIRQCPDQLRTR